MKANQEIKDTVQLLTKNICEQLEKRSEENQYDSRRKKFIKK